MTTRTWLAIVFAPMLGASVYAWLVLTTIPQTEIVGKPTPLTLMVSGAAVGLAFEVAVLLPIQLALRRWWRLEAVRFALLGCFAWLAVCFLAMLALGGGLNGAVAMTALSFLPGATLVLAFWLIGTNHNAA